MTDDETRRAQAAERARRYRARKREAQQAAEPAPSAPPAPDRATGSIEAELETALATMKQLSSSDGAIVALATRTARQIDTLLDDDPIENATRIFSGMNTLTRILHELGGTPTVRQQYEFRSRRLEASGAEGADGDSDAKPEAARGQNVTPLRPPKRRRA